VPGIEAGDEDQITAFGGEGKAESISAFLSNGSEPLPDEG
jgi:hypothetical protein